MLFSTFKSCYLRAETLFTSKHISNIFIKIDVNRFLDFSIRRNILNRNTVHFAIIHVLQSEEFKNTKTNY